MDIVFNKHDDFLKNSKGEGASYLDLFKETHDGPYTTLIKFEPGGWYPNFRVPKASIERIVVEGKLSINKNLLKKGDMFKLAPDEKLELSSKNGCLFFFVNKGTRII